MTTHSVVVTGVGCVLTASVLVSQGFPLSATTTDRTALAGTAPFLVPDGVTQSLVIDRITLVGQGLPTTFGNWDMVAFDATSRYVFVPCEVGTGSGVFRYDTQTATFLTLMEGNGSGNREPDPIAFDPTNDDFRSLDPATWTPWSTVVTGEETTGGRLFEITNPLSASGPFDVRWRSKIPAVLHEGLRFDASGSLYFVDENNSGSVYKFVPSTPGDLSVGQSFVLSVDAYAADSIANAAEDWDHASNLNAQRVGLATWVPMTDAAGNALTAADPFAYVTTTGGRPAADELKGTPYGRPEDLDVSVLASGNEVVFVATTSENRVYSIELLNAANAIVREFVDFDTVNLATGLDVNPLQSDPTVSPGPDTDTTFDNPDNLAVDGFGNVYVLEDDGPGDIWRIVDADNDGVGEALGLFASLGVAGAEPTGFINDPNDPYRFLVNVQHPNNANDALWSLDTRPYPANTGDLVLRSGVDFEAIGGPGTFVQEATSNQVVAYSLVSPGDAFDFARFVLLIQGAPTSVGPIETVPTLWIDVAQPIIVLPRIDGFSSRLSPSGYHIAFVIPPGLGGLSLVVQAAGFNGGPPFLTDARETILR